MSGDRGLRTTVAFDRGRSVRLIVDGTWVDAFEGESVAAALLASGRRTLRLTPLDAAPRGYFCGMGICHDCLVTIDGLPSVRACMTPVRDGMQVELQRGLGSMRLDPDDAQPGTATRTLGVRTLG